MTLCPCGSKKTYENCCGLYIEKAQVPETPEQLMRSRYTAYSLAKIDYIKQTMKGKALIGFDELNAKRWAQNVTWLGLEVIQTPSVSGNIGFVEFAARFLENNRIKTIHERSEFHKEDGYWFYISGSIPQSSSPLIKKTEVARNNPCPCGSGKKFKNCHAR